MKKHTKKLIYVLSIFIFLLIACFNLNIKIKASNNTSTLINVQGASIRTSGTAGIRFLGVIDSNYDLTDVDAFGIALAFGEVDVNDVVVGNIVNGKSVLFGEVNDISSRQYFVNLINIPENMYGQKITARAYVVDNGERVYATTAKTRSLGEVVLKYKADGFSTTLVDNVVTTINQNYKKVFVDGLGTVHIDNPIYETNPSNLGVLLMNDWNDFFETNIDPTTAFVLNGYNSPFSSSAFSTSKTDWSDSKLKAFFQNTEMYSKWGWLLDYIKSELTSGVGYAYAKAQINAIVNNIEDSSNWYYGKHLCSYILSIVNCKE